MKQKMLLIFLFIAGGINSQSQTFLNGDFEYHTVTACDYNNSDSSFNTKFINVHAFGRGFTSNGYIGETDIQTSGCYVTPQNGNWCIGLSSDTASTADAVSLLLSTGLTAGQSYQISFYVYGNTFFEPLMSGLMIGESETDTAFGNLLHIAIPTANTWQNNVFTFTASQNINYITVKNVPNARGWNQVDNFTITNVTGIQENVISEFNIFPNPVSSQATLMMDRSITNATLCIYNCFGQLVLKMEHLSGQKIKFNCDNFSVGHYLIRVTENNRIIGVKKMIKSN